MRERKKKRRPKTSTHSAISKKVDQRRTGASKKKSRQRISEGKKRYRNKPKRNRRLLKEIAVTVFLTLALFLIVLFSTCKLPAVTGYSMTPTLNDQDRLIVYRWGEIKRFSLVYFRNPEKDNWLIRRVIGRPGEIIEYRKGILYIDGNEITERFLPSLVEEGTDTPITDDFQLAEGKIPTGKYFVLGDNRSYATDSRYFGLIDEQEIKGTVVARIFPIHGMSQF